MAGRIIAVSLIIVALLAGGALYYLQIYGFYEPVPDADHDAIRLTLIATGEPEVIIYDDFQAIDAESSPIRYRACFTTSMSHAMLTETYVAAEVKEPRIAPGWFSCFDAGRIASELESGTALAFLGEKNIRPGVDRVVVIAEDGRGYAWNELNDCGKKTHDGTAVNPADCPAPKEAE